MGLPALRILGCGGGVRSVPGIMDGVVGRRPHTGVRLGRLINQNSHAIWVPDLSAAPPKRCNPNDSMSSFEIRVGESHAIFLRNHNVRRYKGPQRHHTGPQAEDNSSPEEPHNPDSRQNRQQHEGATPDQGQCTRTEEVHCLRIGCSAPTNKNKRGADRTSPLPATTSPGTGRRAD